LKTERTQISAIVPMPTPKAAIPDIILMALCDLRENKYRRATHVAKRNPPDVLSPLVWFG